MANLVYYTNEKVVFKTAFERIMSVAEAEIVFAKLVKHFKLGNVYLAWTSGRNRAKAMMSRKVILNVDWNNFGVLCHELAHIKQMIKGNRGEERWHSKKHQRFMKYMIAYCERKNWFEDELKRRLEPKPIKPEPTKDELKLKLISRLQENCKRYETKIKLYSNKLKKAQKKLKRLQ